MGQQLRKPHILYPTLEFHVEANAPEIACHLAQVNTYKNILCTSACKSTMLEKNKMSIIRRMDL